MYIDTATGERFATPSYGPFSLRGLFSTDPANVARNRYGREGLEAMREAVMERGGRDNSGIAALAPPPAVVAPVAPEVPPLTAAELAAIGASTSTMAPIFVDSPQYGLPAALPATPLPPAMNYATAFAAPQPVSALDIFSPFPTFGVR